TRKSFNIDYFEQEIGQFIARLSFTKEELAEIDARIKTAVPAFEAESQKRQDQTERRKKKLSEDRAYLQQNRLLLLRTGIYTPDSLLAEEQKIASEQADLKAAEGENDASLRTAVEDTLKLSELLKQASNAYFLAKSREKEQIVRTIFS